MKKIKLKLFMITHVLFDSKSTYTCSANMVNQSQKDQEDNDQDETKRAGIAGG